MAEEKIKKEEMQNGVEYLANKCLRNANYNGYSDEDLLNATVIFTHVLLDVLYTENKELPQEKKEELAKATGSAIRELIKASTGKDMWEVVKNLEKTI